MTKTKHYVVMPAKRFKALKNDEDVVTTDPRRSLDGKLVIVGVRTDEAKWRGFDVLGPLEASVIVNTAAWNAPDAEAAS